MKKILHNKGFTLVEVMITIGLFTVIMIIGIGAILGVNSTHRKTQSMRAVMDNLSFLMEDMTRSIRLGGDIFCRAASIPPNSVVDITSGGEQIGLDCQNKNMIIFEPYWNPLWGDANNQVIYFIDEDADGRGTIFKKEDDMDLGEPLIAVTPAEIDIDITKSGFTVVGATNKDDGIQPRVTIVLIGTVRVGGSTTEFNLQTTVSQRLLDINAFN